MIIFLSVPFPQNPKHRKPCDKNATRRPHNIGKCACGRYRSKTKMAARAALSTIYLLLIYFCCVSLQGTCACVFLTATHANLTVGIQLLNRAAFIATSSWLVMQLASQLALQYYFVRCCFVAQGMYSYTLSIGESTKSFIDHQKWVHARYWFFAIGILALLYVVF